MSVFICPVCRGPLFKNENTLKCEKGHSYDISKYGYVNLLMSSKSRDKRHGDDKLMIKARRDFLDCGFYRPLLDGAAELILPHSFPGIKILDTGCGECYYTSGIAARLRENGTPADINGIDISKEALRWGGRRNPEISLAVASVFSLPVDDGGCDMLINFFAPAAFDEFLRVLAPGGMLVRAVPLENHLMGLKAAVYDKPYRNPSPDLDIPGFRIIACREIKYELTLSSHDDIQNLFKMTPYYYKTGKADQEKLENLNSLKTPVEFGLTMYEKK